jgi:quercetin dioxygenase-like cupin family protein
MIELLEGDPVPRTKQTISNPISGETITFLQTARDTGGKLVELGFAVAPGGAPPAAHVHPRQTETFAVSQGRCRVSVDGVQRELGPGEVVSVPPGASHTWAAVSELQMTVTLEPALRADEFFEDLFALANAGRVNRQGLPTPLHFAVLLDDYRDLVYLSGPPVGLQKAATAILAKLGRALGKGAKALPERATTGASGTPATEPGHGQNPAFRAAPHPAAAPAADQQPF